MVWMDARTNRNAAEVYHAVFFAAFTALRFREGLTGGVSRCKDWSSGALTFRW